MNFLKHLFIYGCLFLFYVQTSADPNKLSVLIDNHQKIQNNNINTITFISVPFSGHCNILIKAALELAQEKKYTIQFIITGWDNIIVSPKKIKQLTDAGIQVTVINDTQLQTPAPMMFTFDRVVHLTEQTLQLTQNSDVIIYDFFSIEGYIAGKVLSIPTICSIPAIVGPFNPNNPLFQQGLQDNLYLIKYLEKKYNVSIIDKLEMVSDAFLLPSDTKNIIWSWPSLITASDYTQNRHLKHVDFMRPQNNYIHQKITNVKPHQKLIYVSFGTVVTKNLWDNVSSVRNFVQHIFDHLVKTLGNNNHYCVVISTGRNPKDIFSSIPHNFFVYESVPQETLLHQADLFITHGGGNSINEAIDAEVPIIVIPFFGDQHISALNIQKLGIGKAFLHAKDERESAINTQSNIFNRASLHPTSNLSNAIHTILHNTKHYKTQYKIIKQQKPQQRFSLDSSFVLTWYEGDLLYGTNQDRNAFAQHFDLQKYFKIGDMRPFSLLFSDNKNPKLLPKLIDQYNDVLRSKYFTSEYQNKRFKHYADLLSAYHKFLLIHPEYLKPLGHYPHNLPSGQSAALKTLWNMCLGGLDFFLSKGHAIHFVIKDYDFRINKATTKELLWIKKNWHKKHVRNNIIFYRLKDNNIQIVDPEEYHWFQI